MPIPDHLKGFARSHLSTGEVNALRDRITELEAALIPPAGYVRITTNGTMRLIPADEPVFLIRGQDRAGGDAVRAWADLAEAAGAAPDILAVAREHAARMDVWSKKKVPDLAT